MAHDVFISYPHKDPVLASMVGSALRTVDIQPFVAAEDPLRSTSYLARTAIEDAVRSSRVVVLVLSSTYVNESRQILREVSLAASCGIPIIVFRTLEVPLWGSLERVLAHADVVDAWAPPLASHLERLGQTVHRLLRRQRHEHFTHAELTPIEASRPKAGRTTGEAPHRHDVFLSYRRVTGAAEVRAIRGELRARGVRAFLDVDDLGPGHFDEALLAYVDTTPNFVVVLSLQALDGCAAPDDWLRQEIARAIRTHRNILPVIMPGFVFPESLPTEIDAIRIHQGLPYSHEYFQAMIEKLVGFLRPHGP
jgi:hypothetical protein